MGQVQQGWQPPPGASQQEAPWQPAQGSWQPPMEPAQGSWQPPMEPAQQGSWYYPMGPPPSYPIPRRKKSPWLFVGIGAACLVLLAIAIPTFLGHNPPTSTTDRALPNGNSSSTPAGYQSFSDQTYHFTIAVPSTWKQIDPASPGAAAALKEVEQTNPNLRAVLPDFSSLAAKGMKFMAVDPTATDGFAPNMNVIAHAAVGYSDNDLGDIAGQMSQEYGKLGATVTSSQTTTLAGHKALKESLDVPLQTDSGRSITIHEVQYVLGGNDILYIITLSGDSPELSRIVSTFGIW